MTAASELATPDPDRVSWLASGSDVPRGKIETPAALPMVDEAPLPAAPGEGEDAAELERAPSPTVIRRGNRPARAQAPASIDRLPPQNIDSEQGALGSILIDRDAILEVADFLHPEDFYRQAHGRIFAAMLELQAGHKPIDVVTVADALESAGDLKAIGGASYLSTLANDTPTAVHVAQYGRIVERKAVLRRLIQAAGKIAAIGYEDGQDVDEAVARARAEFDAVASGRAAVSASAIMARTGARCLSEVSTSPARPPFLGYLDPDGHTILHGMGGVGKGVLASHWIGQLAAEGQRPLIVDYEGHSGEWARRIHGLAGADGLAAVCYVSPSSADWTGHRGAIWTQADELHALAVEWGATYLVIDSIVSACGALDPLKPEAAGQYSAALVRIGLPALSLAHVTKADSPAYPFGSIFWHNLARMSWSLARDGETVQLVSRKANNYERLGRFVVSATWFEGRLGEVSLTPYAVVLGDRIAEAIATDPLTVPEIVDRLNEDGAETGEAEIKADSVRHALRRGQKAGRFTATDDRWVAS
ncbi:MAG: DnaB-like helicase N-terminal domain-containing protein [Candidatus Limnocylindrales bacterium]|jgi:hypothetical protein